MIHVDYYFVSNSPNKSASVETYANSKKTHHILFKDPFWETQFFWAQVSS